MEYANTQLRIVRLLKLHWKLVTVLSALVLIVIIVLIMLITSSTSPTGSSTPFTQNKPLNIVSLSPPENSKDIRIFTPISISFSRSLTEEEKSLVRLSFSPTFTHEPLWSADSTTYTITPKAPLLSDQVYKVYLVYFDKTETWEFTTQRSSDVPLEDAEKAQIISDKNFADWQEQTAESYPWLEKLPIQAPNYFFYFDIQKKSFIGKLYPQKNSATSVDQQVAEFKRQITQQVQNLGIDSTKYPTEWIVTPE